MKESRAKKEVMFQTRCLGNRDVCPVGGWQRMRTQILPTWQRQEEQKKGREERNFCQIYGVSEGQAQGKVALGRKARRSEGCPRRDREHFLHPIP